MSSELRCYYRFEKKGRGEEEEGRGTDLWLGWPTQ